VQVLLGRQVAEQLLELFRIDRLFGDQLVGQGQPTVLGLGKNVQWSAVVKSPSSQADAG